MGVDARMFVRLRGDARLLKDADVTKASYDLASTIGPENFMITAGRDSFGPPHHCLSPVPRVTPEAAAELGRSDLLGKVVWFQDGPDVEAEPGEQLLEVHLFARYYGESYARGDWPMLRAVIEWLWRRFPDGAVWYGGDSSGICAEYMTRQRVGRINDFFLASGRRSYSRHFNMFRPAKAAPRCETCGGVDMIDCGGGQGSTFWYCDGCGCKAVSGPGPSDLRRLGPREDFFDLGKAEASQ